MSPSTATLQLDRRVLQLEQRNSSSSPNKLSLRRRTRTSPQTPTIIRRGAYGVDETAYAAASSGERVSFVLKVERIISKRTGVASWYVQRESASGEMGPGSGMPLGPIPDSDSGSGSYTLAVGYRNYNHGNYMHEYEYPPRNGVHTSALGAPDLPPRSPSRAPSLSLSISTRAHAHAHSLAHTRPLPLTRTRKPIFVKWARGSDEVNALSREASLYANELRHLQGSVVPECYGYFVGHDLGQQFSCMFLEYCEGVCGAYQYE